MIKLKTTRKNTVVSEDRASCKYVAEFTVNTGNNTEKLFDNLPKFIVDRVSAKFPEIVDYKKGSITISLSRSYRIIGMDKSELKALVESSITRDAYYKAERILIKIKEELDEYSAQVKESIDHCSKVIDDEVDFIVGCLS